MRSADVTGHPEVSPDGPTCWSIRPFLRLLPGEGVRDVVFGVAVVLLLLMSLLAGLAVHRFEAALVRQATVRRLHIQAALRTSALGDRITLLVSAAEGAAADLTGPVADLLAGLPGAPGRLANQFGRLRAFGGFDRLGLVSPDGHRLLPAGAEPMPDIPPGMLDRERSVVFGFYRLAGQPVQFALLVPVRTGGHPAAYLMASVDAQPFVAPYLAPGRDAQLPFRVVLAQASDGGFRLLEEEAPGSGLIVERRVRAGETVISRLRPGGGRAAGGGRPRRGRA